MKLNVNMTHLTFDVREDLFAVTDKLFVSAWVPKRRVTGLQLNFYLVFFQEGQEHIMIVNTGLDKVPALLCQVSTLCTNHTKLSQS